MTKPHATPTEPGRSKPPRLAAVLLSLLSLSGVVPPAEGSDPGSDSAPGEDPCSRAGAVANLRTTAVGDDARGAGDPEGPALPEARSGVPDLLVLEKTLRSIAGRWVEGDGEAILDLARLEAAHPWPPDCLDWAEEYWIHRLGSRDPEALVAWMDLRHAVALQHVPTAALERALHGYGRWIRAAELYVERSRDPELAEQRVADLATRSVLWLLPNRYPLLLAGERKLLEHALELRPEHPDALLALAFLEELEHRPRRALRRLKELRRVLAGGEGGAGGAPVRRELEPYVALRLGINSLRNGDRETGEAELRRLLRVRPELADAPAWLRIVAAQELARHLLARGRRAEARQTLEEALGRFPAAPDLEILLASLEGGSWEEGSSLLRRVVEDWRGDLGPSPRLRYDMGPVGHRLRPLEDRLAVPNCRSREALGRLLVRMPTNTRFRMEEAEALLGKQRWLRWEDRCGRVLRRPGERRPDDPPGARGPGEAP